MAFIADILMYIQLLWLTLWVTMWGTKADEYPYYPFRLSKAIFPQYKAGLFITQKGWIPYFYYSLHEAIRDMDGLRSKKEQQRNDLEFQYFQN